MLWAWDCVFVYRIKMPQGFYWILRLNIPQIKPWCQNLDWDFFTEYNNIFPKAYTNCESDKQDVTEKNQGRKFMKGDSVDERDV